MKNLFMRACRRPTGTFVLRLTLGGIFLFHGITKLIDMESTIAFFATLGLSAVIAWMVALVEPIGGLLVIIGIRVRTAAIALALIMAYVIVFVKSGQGFYAMELDIVLFGLAIGVALLGCGTYSVCSGQHKNCNDCNAESDTCGCDCKKNN
jgi:putative oxidoreductase